MLTIAGGIILAVVGIIIAILVILLLVSVPFRIAEAYQNWARQRIPKGTNPNCPTCHGTGLATLMGGNMRFQVTCHTCFPNQGRSKR